MDNYISVNFNVLLNVKQYASDKVGFVRINQALKAEHLYIHQRKKNNQSQGKNTQLNQTWKRFQDSVILQEKHNISSQEVVNYELGPLPLSIAYAVWGKVKSNKASLGRELKKIVPIESELP